MSISIEDFYPLFVRLVEAVEAQNAQKAKKPPKRDDATLAALAMVEIGKGANSFNKVAEALGISASKAKRTPGIRRALEICKVDRRTSGDEEFDEFSGM